MRVIRDISFLATFVRLALLAFFLFSPYLVAQQKDVTIFDSRKNITLADDEPAYRDFYLNGGTEMGIQTGMVIDVTRAISLYDAYQNRSPGELLVRVGQVRIIHVQGGLSVARAYSLYSREDRPMLEDDFIMIGDRLDLGSAKMESNLKSTRETQTTAAVDFSR